MSGAMIGAAAITAGAGLLGGIMGKKSRKKEIAQAQAFEAQRIRMMVRDAKAAGIHPLAAMGVAANYQNPFQGLGPDPMTTGLQAAGEAVGNGLINYAQRKDAKAEAAARDKLATQQLQLNARVANSEIMRNVADAQKAQAEAQAVTREQFLRARALMGPRQVRTDNSRGDPKLGTKSNPYPTHIWAVGPDGRKVMVRNPELAMGLEELIGGFWQDQNEEGDLSGSWWSRNFPSGAERRAADKRALQTPGPRP